MGRVVLLVTLLWVAACAPPPTAAAPAHVPAAPPSHRVSVGLASWYGGFHHGRRTASGERFDMNALTAAHRTLPLGTRVRVTNMINGKSVVVRVNDRGPTPRERIIDLSRGAAAAIAAIERGVVPVQLVLVD
jgi:rare lipoprotein A